MNPIQALRKIHRLAFTHRAYKFMVREFVRPDDLDTLAETLACTRHLRALEPLLMEVPRGQRVMVIAPHEDDEMIGPGGTILKLARTGTKVRVLYLADDTGERGEARRRETMKISNVVGYETEFLGYSANDIPVDSASTERVARAIDGFSPDVLMVPFLSDDHHDHRVASQLLSKAYKSGGLRSRPEVWAYQVYSAILPNVIVDITEVAADKSNAICMWQESAMRTRDWAHYALGLNAYNCRLLTGNNGRRYVEAFFVVPFADYMSICSTYLDKHSVS